VLDYCTSGTAGVLETGTSNNNLYARNQFNNNGTAIAAGAGYTLVGAGSIVAETPAITPSATGSAGLTVAAMSGQTGDIVQFKDSSGNVNTSYDQYGRRKAGSGYAPQVRCLAGVLGGNAVADPTTALTAAAYGTALGSVANGAVCLIGTGGTITWNTNDVIYVSYSWTNANGETYFAPVTKLTATASTTTGEINFGPLTALTNATSATFYASSATNPGLTNGFVVVNSTGSTSAVSGGVTTATAVNSFGTGAAGKTANTTVSGQTLSATLTTASDSAGLIATTTANAGTFAIGGCFHILFANAWGRSPIPLVCEADSNGAARFYITNMSTSSFVIGTAAALATSKAINANYLCVG
jgi:hypothetical protein